MPILTITLDNWMGIKNGAYSLDKSIEVVNIGNNVYPKTSKCQLYTVFSRIKVNRERRRGCDWDDLSDVQLCIIFLV